MRPLRKAVFPVAGRGLRMLPATRAVPKELLPVGGVPALQYSVDEAVAAGCELLIFVTSADKPALEAYFTQGPPVVPAHVKCVFVHQAAAAGLGDAVLTAAPLIEPGERFAVVLPDDVVFARPGVLQQLREAMPDSAEGAFAVCRVLDPAALSSYGVVAPSYSVDATHRVRALVEKPAPGAAPSNLAIVGRYILSSQVLDVLAKTPRAASELQLTPALAARAQVAPYYGLEFEGLRFDCGSLLGLHRANAHIFGTPYV